MLENIVNIILPAFLAFLGTLWIHPKVLNIAILKNIVDNPDARKLQRNPVPVLGGVAVFFGIAIGLCCSPAMFNNTQTFIFIAAMLVMLYIGTTDDIIGLSPSIRFLIEIIIVAWFMYANNSSINCFWGLWGIGAITLWVSYALTIFAAVGIINAINLIDGVNGLSSGYCFMSSVLFAIFFYVTGNQPMTIFALSAAGAIIPFFLHNVFGQSTKMFIGDGGTLVIGTMLAMFVIDILDVKSGCNLLAAKGVGLIPFTLSVLSIPVLDTLRVMSTRFINKKPIYYPDKTHLHHIFIDLGFSHIGTTISILSLNFIVVAIWFLSYKSGASADAQLYIVVATSFLFTFVFYWYAKRQIEKNTKALAIFKSIAKILHIEKKGIWRTIQQMIDKL